MKIFIDIRCLDTPIRSGIPEYAFDLTNALLDRKGNDEYVLFTNSFRKRLENLPLKNKSDACINWKVPNRILDAISFFPRWPKIDRIVKADVYFSPHFNVLAFKEPRRHVVTIHDLSFAHFPEFFPRRKNLWHFEQDWRRQISEAGKVIAVSDFTREDILEMFRLPDERVVRVYPGLNERYRPLPRSKTGREAPFFLYVGTLEPRKNVIGLIRAFNILKTRPANKDFRLVIAGAPGWLYDRIFKEATSSPYAGDIKLLGPVTSEEVLHLYNNAAAFVYPSFFEGFGFPPLEAQKCGCPVVASNRSSLPEVLGPSALLVDPSRLDEIATAMEAAAMDGKLRTELIRRGLENSSRFDWQSSAEEVRKVLKLKDF